MKRSDATTSSKLLLAFLFAAIMLALTGCGGQQIVYKEKIVYKPITIPKHMLKKCTFSAPAVSPFAYSQMSKEEQQKNDTSYINTLLTEGKVCSDGFPAIDAYQERELKIILETQP